jgi:DNA polymerase V
MHYIGLMDCNNFFVSCERLFRPDLLKKPVAVLSSNDGCIVARSQEVKELGIPMGAPYFMVRAICKKEGVTLFSSNFRLYRDISARVMHALCEEVDTFEVYSIDEAFFSIEETVTEEEVLLLRERIMQKTGIPVSFGIARTKTIAKAAGDHAKKESGVSILDATLWETKISEIPCGSIWGIGRQTSAKLTKLGINTVADLISKDIT